ncbi:hypothetical protein DI09_59p30 [Mitosporidium daphniae]|uniref:RNA helicase n=1 Tax=Mitosporidium daphniae TaxID=1485682 RepID=A0A098VNT7_9MICR|nr:uncharacterized protein DI09_59p30 [Mitosporidium daphniae]KGG50713.1 hypothetical protein DI09_59p30 [Mitosporidium daphniae]|eukprot:XP_013237156.1 uncharacterized protein DI09_59p30 [Mitosporidium daphniae]
MPQEIDPLDAFMSSLQPQIDKDLAHSLSGFSSQNIKPTIQPVIDDSSSDDESAFEVEQAKAIKAIGTDPLLSATPEQIMALDILRGFLNFDKPTPIQSQAIPALMSGRDVIGIARTGSGKTIAYLLPLFRHVRDQRPVSSSEGPIALVLTPTRELAVQVGGETKKLAHAFGVKVVCAYGGSSIKDQIGELKRGAEILISTPGRLIDLLTANAGRVLNLRRVTFVIIDEADRMFDMGFEPQITKIMELIRPDKQMEQLAKKISTRPIEIMVGGRSTVNTDIIQDVRIVPEEKKFFLLLEILGKWAEENTNSDYSTRCLIFVDRQDDADLLFKDLLRKGHICIAIHGGKDQSDRDSAFVDFKNGTIPILIATSVASRGLDVRELNLVINYDCPNHMEDYVHRVGRTGRAGNKGTAITFISPDQERFAVDISRALSMSNAPVPPALAQMASSKHWGALFFFRSFGEDLSDDEDHLSLSKKDASSSPEIDDGQEPKKRPKLATIGAADGSAISGPSKMSLEDSKQLVEDIASKINSRVKASESSQASLNQLKLGQERFTQLTSASSGDVVQVFEGDKVRHFKCEIDINDYPQYARWKVTSKDVMLAIQETCYCSMVVRGTHIPQNKTNPSGERRLHIVIEGDNELSILRARKDLLEIIIEATSEALLKGAGSEPGKYSIL